MNVPKIAHVTPLDRERLVRPILEGRRPATVWRFLAKERLSFKKSLRASEARAARRRQAGGAMEAVSG
jgi:hypothetical protein